MWFSKPGRRTHNSRPLNEEFIDTRPRHTIDKLRINVFEYIELYYNRHRSHSTIGFDIPIEYEKKRALTRLQPRTECLQGREHSNLACSPYCQVMLGCGAHHSILPLMPTSNVVTREPHPSLRRYVDRYVGYRLGGYPPGVHRGLPSRFLTFIVQLDQPRAFVAGLRTSAVLLPHSGNHHGIAIELTVRGARALFGTPSRALTETVADLCDLIGRKASTLPEQLADCTSWERRFAILDRILLSSLDPSNEPVPEVVHAWDVLTTSRGEATRVESLAKAIGWSRRHFSEIFGREVGLPPRQLARVLRFERSCHLARSMPHATMTEIAFGASYFDHAHMLYEWRALAACTPGQWLAEEFLSVQAEAAATA
jgi:AraC-like DNA-binding protein